MSQISTEVQKLNQDAIVTFCYIDATDIGGGIFRFTHARNGTVLFGGNSYLPLAFETEGFEIRPDSEPTTPILRIQTTDSFIPAFVKQYSDGRGAIFCRMRTYRAFLDDGDDPDSTQLFPPEVYYIERKSKDDRIEGVLEWELSSILDQEGMMFPIRQVVRGYCDYIYRRWSGTEWIPGTCPYGASRYYDRKGVSTANPANDVCGKRLSDCKLRFGQNAVLPYRGFPGVGRVR